MNLCFWGVALFLLIGLCIGYAVGIAIGGRVMQNEYKKYLGKSLEDARKEYEYEQIRAMYGK